MAIWNLEDMSGTLPPSKGGTGVNNGTSTITLTGNLSWIGGFNFIANLTGNTNITFPTSGTLLATPGALTTGKVLVSLFTNVAESGVTTTELGYLSGVTGTTGAGKMVLDNSPELITPNIGTPSAGVLTNCTGLPISSGVSGLGTGVAAALAINVGTSGSFITNGGALGAPSSGTLTNATGLPLTTGVTGILPYANGGTNANTSWTAGSVFFAGATSFGQDNSNFYWNSSSHVLSVNSGGDLLGTDSINIYKQFDSFTPNLSDNGFSISHARGTSPTFTESLANDYVGVLAWYPYNGTSWAEGASIRGYVEGTTATNRGMRIEFWTKVNGGVLTKSATIDSNQDWDFNGNTLQNGVLANTITATTQSQKDGTQKVSTTAYVDTAMQNDLGLDAAMSMVSFY